ncbi:MAG: DotI/IcmL/TraM family protein [Proteobacteria bacterium]|nr:DotI/IcmL/TraM family protein [Pseudomonadota bacterium]
MSRYLIDLVKSRKDFYRDHFRATVRILIGSLLVTMVWLAALVYEIMTRPEPKFYATDSASFITPLDALNTPNESSEYLLPPSEPQEIRQKDMQGNDIEQEQNQSEENTAITVNPVNPTNAESIQKKEEEDSL